MVGHYGVSLYRTKDILHVQRLLGHKNVQKTLIYIDLESKLFNSTNGSFTVRVAHNVGEAISLVEAGFEYVTVANLQKAEMTKFCIVQ